MSLVYTSYKYSLCISIIILTFILVNIITVLHQFNPCWPGVPCIHSQIYDNCQQIKTLEDKQVLSYNNKYMETRSVGHSKNISLPLRENQNQLKLICTQRPKIIVLPTSMGSNTKNRRTVYPRTQIKVKVPGFKFM
jgi:hypothetical protein